LKVGAPKPHDHNIEAEMRACSHGKWENVLEVVWKMGW
jgi:hypothetical protein